MVIEFTDETIRNAVKFRVQNKGEKFSYVDSLGYYLASANKAKFLTSGKGFNGISNVESVK